MAWFAKKEEDAHKKIADDILASGESVPDSLYRTIVHIAQKYPGAVYWICRKYLQEHHSFYISDLGHIGISDRIVPDYFFPGDIILYGAPTDLKSGDIIQIIFTLEHDQEINIIHGKVLKFRTDGHVKVKSLMSDEEWELSRWDILGKVIKIIKPNESEWNAIFDDLGDYKNWLKDILKELRDQIEDSEELANKEKYLKEIQSRLKLLR